MGRKREEEGLKTTSQSLAILEYIEDTNGATITEIMEGCDLAKSTAYNHINTLYEKEYLARFGNEYFLGMKLLRMGMAARKRTKMYQLAGEKVTELANQIEEVTDFCILEYKTVYTVFSEVLSRNESYVGTGKQFPPHASAAGKAILAESPQDRVNEVLNLIDLVELTENSITSELELIEDLQRVEERGFSYNDEEYRNGLRTVAAPVVLPDGRVLGALTVGGPTYRFKGEYYREEIPQKVQRAVSELEERIAAQYWHDSK